MEIKSNTYKIFQIYFNETQKPNLFPEYEHFYNKDCTLFFENSVIRNLIENNKHINYDYFGVLSHSIKKKIKGFNPTKLDRFIKQTNLDIFNLGGLSSQGLFRQAERTHKNFGKYMDMILGKLGFEYKRNERAHNLIYYNAFIATREFWDHYTNELLFPFMDIIEQDEEIKSIVMKNASYKKKLPKIMAEKYNIKHYPYHPFLCERLPNIFLFKYANKRRYKYGKL